MNSGVERLDQTQCRLDGYLRELGYVLTPALWGSGVATELARALLRWHGEHPDPRLEPDVYGLAFAENAASRRVLEKAGFTLWTSAFTAAGRTPATGPAEPNSDKPSAEHPIVHQFG